ncbi:hypothetical protein MMA231_00886 [Asticcacaulis sp. MM231]|uniref:hypothetical protein n=1 Tax=Asticcacaulis sp. MM231 TaxID=3157666 RepID=UPI0032D581BE
MSSSNLTLNADDRGTSTTRKPGAAGFLILAVLAAALSAFALYKGQAPVRTPFPEDWIIWARGTAAWAGILALGAFLLLIGVIGTLRNLLPAPKPAVSAPRRKSRPEAVEAAPAPVMAVAEDMQLATRAAESRGTLHFNARTLERAPAFESQQAVEAMPDNVHIEAAPVAVEPPHIEVQSLERAIFTDHAAFSDNASDSFMTRHPEVVVETVAEVPAFDSSAALADTHGLTITTPTAQIIPLHPPVETVAAQDEDHDPLAAALLRETPDVVTHAPQGDINAVISSAMRFAPQSEPHVAVEPTAAPEAVPEAIPAALTELVTQEIVADVLPAPVVPAPVVIDDEAEIRQAVQTALSVWPDATRAIAADELSTRISRLYYDKSAASQKAFQLVASGDLSAASAALANHADALALAGNHAEAAELWRVSGALHMGRDDSKAMAAYEHVSELDPNDANIHLYLTRRYQMSGDTAKLPAVIGRALGAISDPATRAELLAPYADLKLKAGDARAAGDAFEELSRLHETTAYLKPDDVGARSTHAITLARYAQAREMQGAFDQAGPLYKKAYGVFADLSALKPEHPGLRAMAENALKDAQRFNMA